MTTEPRNSYIVITPKSGRPIPHIKSTPMRDLVVALFQTPEAALDYVEHLNRARPITFNGHDRSWGEHFLCSFPPGSSCLVYEPGGFEVAILQKRANFLQTT